MAVRLSMRWVSLCSLVCCLWPAVVSAQTAQSYDYLGVTTKVVIGANGEVLSNYDQVLKVIGLPSVSGGASSAIGIDSSGNVRKDSGTTISTAGLWTFGSLATFNANIRTTAGAISAGSAPMVGLALDNNGDVRKDSGLTVDASGHWFFSNWVYGPFTVATSTGADAALGFDNVRIHQNAGTPRLTLEDNGFSQWTMDNSSGALRFYRTNSSGTSDSIPMSVESNMTLAPYGKSVLPATPYGFSIGSITLPIDALWAGNLFVQTLVAIEEIGTTGGDWLIGNTNVLDEPITSSATTAIFRYNNFSNGDYAIFKTLGRTEGIKITSSATAVNLHPDSSMEGGADANYTISSGDTATYSTTKSFRGNKSILLTHGGSTTLQFGHTGSAATSTVYTFCGYFRRVDGATPVVGDIVVSARGGTAVPLTVEPASYDAWFRMCGTFTSGVGASTDIPILDFSTSTTASTSDWYTDAWQLEAGSAARPYSATRSSYTIHRGDIGTASPWNPGDAAFDLGGTAGYGWLQCYAISGLKSTSEVGPSCVANVRTGTTATAWAPRAAWGQMNGLYSYASSTFGFATGDPSATWAAMDDTNGFRIMSGATQKFRAYADGHLSVVEGAITLDNLGIRIQNTSSVSDEAKAYTFYGSGTPSHAKRPGLFYSEGSGTSGIELSNDAGSMTLQTSTTMLLTAAAAASQLTLGSNMTLATSGNMDITVSGSLTINGSAGATSTGGCPGAQHVSNWVLVRGFVIGFGCS